MKRGNSDDAVVLILLSGLPGSGKTTFALALGERLPLQHIESDAIRRGVASQPAYTAEENAKVFGRVEAEARRALEGGRHALVDATNLTQRDRKRFLKLAAQLGAAVVAVRLVAPEAVVRERLSRPRTGHSEAGVEVFEKMQGRAQAFSVPVVVVETRFSLGPSLDLVAQLVAGGSE